MRKLLVCMMMVMSLFAFSGVASAQTPACGTLSAADCEILTQSAAAQSSLSSASFDFNLNISAGEQPIALTGDGSYAIDPAVAAALSSTDLTSVTDPTAALALLGNAIKGFSGELNINAMGMIDINLVLVNGIGYFNFASVAPLLGGPQALTQMGLPADWAGLDLVGALDMLAPMLGSVDMTEVETPDADAQAQLMASVMNHVVVSRAADEGGQAVFVSTVDLAGLFQDEAFLDFVTSQATGEVTEAQIEQMSAAVQQIGDGFSFSATQKVDLSTFFVTSIGFSFDLDGAALTAVSGQEVEDVTVEGAFNFSDFNAAPAVSAPAGAPVATIMDLMGMMGGMGGM